MAWYAWHGKLTELTWPFKVVNLPITHCKILGMVNLNLLYEHADANQNEYILSYKEIQLGFA